MRAAGKPSSSPPVLSTTVKIEAGHAYTVAGVGPASGLRLAVLHDTLTTPKGRSLVRVIQASLTEKKVTVTAGGKMLASNLAFGSVTSYVSVAPGTADVKAAGGTMSTSKNVSLPADTTHTIVVLDDPGHLSIDPLTDAAGSNAAARRRGRDGIRRHGAAPGLVTAAVGRGHGVRCPRRRRRGDAAARPQALVDGSRITRALIWA